MVKTKSVEQATKAWEDSINRVPARYSEGIANTDNWQSAAIAGEDVWKQKTMEAIQSSRRARGLSRVSNDEWKQRASGKGAANIAQGMNASKQKFNNGIARVIQVIQNTNLPARTADPIQNVQNRVIPLVRNLAKMKDEQ